MRSKGRKVAKHCVFPMTCGSGGSKSRLAKAACAEPSDERWKVARRCGAKHIWKSKSVKNWRVWSTFGSWDVEKVHAVVARSTFRIQNVQNTSASAHFWKLRCRKSARRSGPKHMSMSKVEKTVVWSTFGRSDTVSRGRRKGLCTLSKVSKMRKFCSSFIYNNYTTLHSATLHLQLQLQLQLHYTTLITLHYPTLITLHYPTLITLHYTTHQYTTVTLH